MTHRDLVNLPGADAKDAAALDGTEAWLSTIETDDELSRASALELSDPPEAESL